jgi:hypothetical protein
MHGLHPKRLQDHHLQCSRKQVAVFRILCHWPDRRLFQNILFRNRYVEGYEAVLLKSIDGVATASSGHFETGARDADQADSSARAPVDGIEVAAVAKSASRQQFRGLVRSFRRAASVNGV